MNKLTDIAINALEDIKAQNINIQDVKDITSFTDTMVFATGTSTTHIKAITSNLIKEVKKNSILPLGIEGENNSDWVLIDLGSVIVHVMLEATREYYNLEKLWSPLTTAASTSASASDIHHQQNEATTPITA